MSARTCVKGALGVHSDDALIADSLDEVYPVHFIDQAAIVRSSLISYTFRYEHVLDAQKLHDSLAILLDCGNWRKLGGRLRQNEHGNLEIHVPRYFSSERPPFRFSHIKHGMTMDAHRLASRLPRKTGMKPSIQEGCRLFREFSIPSTLPNDIKHYLSTDEPLICLHINSFADGTLVSFTFPHSLADAMGAAKFLQAWTHVLRNGNAESLDVQFEGAIDDVTASVGSDNDEIARNNKFVLEDRQTKGFSLVAFLARYALDTLTQRNIETHHLYLPISFLSHLRKEAAQEWEVTQGGQGQPMPFVSDGDLITAWGSRMVLSSSKGRGSAAICNVFDIRGRLDCIKSKPNSHRAAYIQNLILPSVSLLTPEEARNSSVSQIALRVRKAVLEQTTDAQVRGLMRIARTWLSSMGSMPLFMSWNTSRVIACTNWSKAGFLELADFGPAAIESKGDAMGDHSVKPVAYWGTTLSVTDNPRDTFIVYGKDNDGDYMVHAYLRKETWELIRSELKSYGKQ
ncbi:hypothetical protein F4808DRAFT_466656 [Astrocystis sublimbata]|nr:hypothetical protein F4808DRAFT_466656 [Astrocystis sublimbata]